MPIGRRSRPLRRGGGSSARAGALTATAATVGVVGPTSRSARPRPAPRRPRSPARRSPFHGEHQAGIVTPGAGPAAVRHASTSRPPTRDDVVDAAAGLDERGAADDRGPARRRATTPISVRRPTTPARRSACGPSSLTLTFGFGPRCSPRTASTASGSPRSGRRRSSTSPSSRGDEHRSRRAATATSPCRPARTIRRSASTPSATSRASHAAPRCCVGRSSASGARRAPTARRPTPRNLMGFKDGTNNLTAEDTAALRRTGLGRRTVTIRRGWRAAPTWSPAASAC